MKWVLLVLALLLLFMVIGSVFLCALRSVVRVVRDTWNETDEERKP
jgi:hypothetical protein